MTNTKRNITKPKTPLKAHAPLEAKRLMRQPIVILPYKIGSQSARNLANEMQKFCGYRPRRLFTDRPNPTYVRKPWHILINWGTGSHVENLRLDGINRMVNSVHSVGMASNKLTTFNKLKGVDGIRIPEFTTDRAVGEGWLRDGCMVVCRHKLSGHSGDGIALVDPHDSEDKTLPEAPLYVKYVKKQKEFRVHVVFGEVIDVQEKRKARRENDNGAGVPTNYQIRNHQTGWVYCREDITEPGSLRAMAIATVSTLGLDFGAVDLIYNEKWNEVYVLEVNTAPGLEGTTVTKYAEAFWKGLK